MAHPDARLGAASVVLLWTLITLLGCDYARMTTDESFDTYEAELPSMPEGVIPQLPSRIGFPVREENPPQKRAGGSAMDANIGAYRLLGPAALKNPLSSNPAVLARGRRSYTYFCVHCHAPRGDGRGTVGQSFAPLPTDLTTDAVQHQSDGELYFKIAYGFRRHPDLSHTMVEDDLWAVIHFVRRMTPAATAQ